MDDMKLRKYILVRFSLRTGKIETVLEAYGTAMLRMWALNNTKKGKSCIVFDKETGEVSCIMEGTADGFPKIMDTRRSKKGLGNIEVYCPGLLEEVQKDDNDNEVIV